MDTNKFMEGYIGAMKAAGVRDEDMQDMIALGEAAAMAHEVPAMLPAIDTYIAKRAQEGGFFGRVNNALHGSMNNAALGHADTARNATSQMYNMNTPGVSAIRGMREAVPGISATARQLAPLQQAKQRAVQNYGDIRRVTNDPAARATGLGGLSATMYGIGGMPAAGVLAGKAGLGAAAAGAAALPLAAGVGAGIGYGARKGIDALTPSGRGMTTGLENIGGDLMARAKGFRKIPGGGWQKD